MNNEWMAATVAPERDGSYEVRVISPDQFEHEETIMPAEWRGGRWRLKASYGQRNGDLTSDFCWREKRGSRAC